MGNGAIALQQDARQTLYYERWRAVCTGVVESAVGTFLLLIAVQHFKAGATAKALIASGASLGMLLTPLVVHLVSIAKVRAARAAAVITAVGSIGFLVAALLPSESVFVAGSVTALVSTTLSIPLLTQIYQDNYPAEQRGALFSTTVVIRIASAAAFAHLAGKMLDGNMQRFPWLLLIYFVGLLVSAFCLARCPSQPLLRQSSGAFHALHWVRDDPIFRRTLTSWMLMGFSNLMMFPLRVELLANILGYPADTVALLNAVIPNLARLCVSSTWGRLFDRMNFFSLRIVLNLGFALGILAFFTGDSIWGLLVGAIIFGISNAGGDVTWSLYVTKMAPADRVAEYMGVHAFLTGLRGVVAPLAAFHLLKCLSIEQLAGICAALIVLASVLLVPEARASRQQQPTVPLTRDVTE